MSESRPAHVPVLVRAPASLKPGSKWRLWKSRSVPVPTFRGWLVLGVLMVGVVLVGLRLTYPFFAVNQRLEAPVLVVEGWGVDYMMDLAAAEATNGGYQRVFVTGGPMERTSAAPRIQSWAEMGGELLKERGVPSHLVTAVPSFERYQNRTFSAAWALREYCRTNDIPLTRLNLVSLGMHTRRSRLSFQRALGPEVEIGTIAVDSREFDPKRWWRFSEGVKSVISESIGLPYAWLSVDYGN